MFMCKSHWYKLRKPMRDAIWAEYTPGQERTKMPSIRYIAVQQRAIGEVAFKPNDEAAAIASAPYIVRSELLRQQCRDEGVGDPLATLCAPGR